MSATLFAVQFSDDETKRDALFYAIRQADADSIDVLHVFDHRGQFIGRWVHESCLTREEREGCELNPDDWHRHETDAWGWMPEVRA